MSKEQPDRLGEPIVVSTRVGADPPRAFEVFTRRLGDWWDPRLTPDASTYEGAEVSEVVGGTVSLRHDGEDFPIGEVQEFKSGRRFVMSFHLALPLEHPTTLTVTFEPTDGGTLVTLAHGGWNDGNVHRWANFNEWPNLMQRFAVALAD